MDVWTNSFRDGADRSAPSKETFHDRYPGNLMSAWQSEIMTAQESINKLLLEEELVPIAMQEGHILLYQQMGKYMTAID